MKLNAFANLTSSTGAMKANWLHLHSELPRKMVSFDLSPTSAN
jgi:hypothetical protein